MPLAVMLKHRGFPEKTSHMGPLCCSVIHMIASHVSPFTHTRSQSFDRMHYLNVQSHYLSHTCTHIHTHSHSIECISFYPIFAVSHSNEHTHACICFYPERTCSQSLDRTFYPNVQSSYLSHTCTQSFHRMHPFLP